MLILCNLRMYCLVKFDKVWKFVDLQIVFNDGNTRKLIDCRVRHCSFVSKGDARVVFRQVRACINGKGVHDPNVVDTSRNRQRAAVCTQHIRHVNNMCRCF
mmetsp:Transcript_12383/g.28246  ORF Transcript_12383/g.28246 Transcript_12383/m.28246 type:complete len:101 (+) Transcript_12383:529-831(+)